MHQYIRRRVNEHTEFERVLDLLYLLSIVMHFNKHAIELNEVVRLTQTYKQGSYRCRILSDKTVITMHNIFCSTCVISVPIVNHHAY